MRKVEFFMTYSVAKSPSPETSEAVIISGPMRGQIVPIAAAGGFSPQEMELLRQFAQVQKETADELEQLSKSMQAFNKRMKEKLEALRK